MAYLTSTSVSTPEPRNEPRNLFTSFSMSLVYSEEKIVISFFRFMQTSFQKNFKNRLQLFDWQVFDRIASHLNSVLNCYHVHSFFQFHVDRFINSRQPVCAFLFLAFLRSLAVQFSDVRR